MDIKSLIKSSARAAVNPSAAAYEQRYRDAALGGADELTARIIANGSKNKTPAIDQGAARAAQVAKEKEAAALAAYNAQLAAAAKAEAARQAENARAEKLRQEGLRTEISQLENMLTASAKTSDANVALARTQWEQQKNALQAEYDASTAKNDTAKRDNYNSLADNERDMMIGLADDADLARSSRHLTGSDAVWAASVLANTGNKKSRDIAQNYGQAERDIDQAWGDFVSKNTAAREQAQDAYNYSVAQEQRAKNQTDAGYLGQLAQKYAGLGDYAKRDSYINQQKNLASNVPSYTPTFSGVVPTYTAPDLGSFVSKANTPTFSTTAQDIGSLLATNAPTSQGNTGDSGMQVAGNANAPRSINDLLFANSGTAGKRKEDNGRFGLAMA